MDCQIPVISIVGQGSNSGKTTLLEKLIREGKNRGWRIATIKHDVHGFEIDIPGKDSWRHAQAGADIVVLSSPKKIAVLEAVTEDSSLDEIISRIKGVDLILTEGYKRNDKPKIEVFRSEVHKELFCKPEELFAIASDVKFENGVPCFELDDARGICDMVQRFYGLP
ncbi:MAG: molybdopterin-guanine dinucleotide biosynthesis protein B [Desulfitobacterium hafniense]|nr:molybdopterin-guanine dinucleotide biosynthesis protein B [Desulfitobacterium hafniense]